MIIAFYLQFNQQIYSVFSSNENTFVLFENGNLYTLEEALELRKTLNCEEIISNTEKIEDILYITLNSQLHVGLIVRSANDFYLYWTKYNSVKCVFTKKKLHRDSFNLRGYVFYIMKDTVHLLTLCKYILVYSNASNFQVTEYKPS